MEKGLIGTRQPESAQPCSICSLDASTDRLHYPTLSSCGMLPAPQTASAEEAMQETAALDPQQVQERIQEVQTEKRERRDRIEWMRAHVDQHIRAVQQETRQKQAETAAPEETAEPERPVVSSTPLRPSGAEQLALLLGGTQEDAALLPPPDPEEFDIRDGVLLTYKGSAPLVQVPQGVVVIGKGAFQFNRKLQGIVLPDSVRVIEEKAFDNCIRLRAVVFPRGLRTIESRAFYNCQKLEQAELRDGLARIGKEAFYLCKSLWNVVLPAGTGLICEGAFLGCDKLNRITLPEDIGTVEADAFPKGISWHGPGRPQKETALKTRPGWMGPTIWETGLGNKPGQNKVEDLVEGSTESYYDKLLEILNKRHGTV